MGAPYYFCLFLLEVEPFYIKRTKNLIEVYITNESISFFFEQNKMEILPCSMLFF